LVRRVPRRESERGSENERAHNTDDDNDNDNSRARKKEPKRNFKQKLNPRYGGEVTHRKSKSSRSHQGKAANDKKGPCAARRRRREEKRHG
jgi:hypothetical protein